MNKEAIAKVAYRLDESQRQQLNEMFSWLLKKLESVPSEDKQNEWIDRGLKWFVRDAKVKLGKAKVEMIEGRKVMQSKLKIKGLDEELFFNVAVGYEEGTLTVVCLSPSEGYLFSVVGESLNRFYTANVFDQAISQMNAWKKSKGLS